jgi:hypothetical protein
MDSSTGNQNVNDNHGSFEATQILNQGSYQGMGNDESET